MPNSMTGRDEQPLNRIFTQHSQVLKPELHTTIVICYIPHPTRWILVRGKSILLIIGGGIAAYKSLELVRRLSERGVKTRAILTKAGAEFVTPLSVASLTGGKGHDDLFSLTDEA